MPDLEAVRNFFKGDKYATEATCIVIEKAEKGHSVVSLEPDGRHLNAVGGLMGAVYYTMADFAFAVAENCELDSDTITVTQATQMNFLRSWHGGKITCNADIVKDGTGVDIVFISSGAIRGDRLGEVVTKGDLRKVYPYDNKVVEFKITGKQLREALLWMFRDESIDAPYDGGEFYQLSKGVKVVYDQGEHRIETLELNGRPIQDDDMLKIAMGDFHYNNIEHFLHLKKADIQKNGRAKTLSSSGYVIIEERMSGVPLIRVDREERIVIKCPVVGCKTIKQPPCARTPSS